MKLVSQVTFVTRCTREKCTLPTCCINNYFSSAIASLCVVHGLAYVINTLIN